MFLSDMQARREPLSQTAVLGFVFRAHSNGRTRFPETQYLLIRCLIIPQGFGVVFMSDQAKHPALSSSKIHCILLPSLITASSISYLSCCTCVDSQKLSSVADAPGTLLMGVVWCQELLEPGRVLKQDVTWLFCTLSVGEHLPQRQLAQQ